MASRILMTLAVLGTAQAHFNLLYPQTVGFSDDAQSNAPCGGFTPNFSKDNVTDFHIGGDAISTKSTHPQGNWLYRITLDESASGNWTQIFPIVQQTGLGAFCEPVVTIPKEYQGKRGVLSVVSSTPDGVLFQCSSVNFVPGSVQPPQACSNGSSVTARFSSDPRLDALVGKGNGTSNAKGNKTENSTAALIVGHGQGFSSVVMGLLAVWVGVALTS